jgi:hypothetical protein
MNMKIKDLLNDLPATLGADEIVRTAAAKTMTMLYDYEVENNGDEFKRLGNSKKECKQRLFPIFCVIDGMVQYHNADPYKAEEAKKLLVLASTPDTEAQEAMIAESPAESSTFALTEAEAVQTGRAGWWSM